MVPHPADDAPVLACVGALVNDPSGALLLIRRRNPPGAGLWSLPGGRVEPGESDAEALVREVAEETGLAVVAGAWVGTVHRAAPGGGTYAIRDLAATPVDPGPSPALRAGDDALDARWVDAAAYAALDAAGALVPGLTAALAQWGRVPR